MSSLYDPSGETRELHKTVIEIKKLLQAALERGSEKLEYGKGSTVSADDVRGILAPKPAPATVEKYNAFKLSFVGTADDSMWPFDSPKPDLFRRDPIGEVVATRKRHQWLVKLPNGVAQYLNDDFYTALVEHLTSVGVWERKI